MTWTPISGTMPQYSTANNQLASDYYLKFYESGTTTPINMATDSTGTTLLAKCALSSDGYPITNPLDDSTKFIPHIDQSYRIVLFTSEADADANNTTQAAFNIDGLEPQIAPLATAENVAIRNTTLRTQDDYDRSPLFVDGEDFTAGAGPHVITVPAGWTPSNSDVRFYKVAANGVITDLTPTSRDATTFTLAETLLSTDTVFIGDDSFRNQFEGDPKAIREKIDVYSKSETTTEITTAVDTRDAPAASGFTGASKVYLKDEITGGLTVSSLTIDTWTSVGRTGSGATQIWADMDALPANAKTLKLQVSINVTYAPSISGIRFVKAFFRKNGVTLDNGVRAIASKTDKNATGNEFQEVTAHLEVPLSSSGLFDAKWQNNDTTNPFIGAVITGYGV